MSYKYFSLLILVLILIVACNKDESDRVIYNSEECLPPVTLIQGSQICDTSFTNYYCDIIDFGTFELSPEARGFMPQFCVNEGEDVVYINHKNESQTFTLKSKDFIKAKSISTAFFPCENDQTKYIGYCQYSESLRYQLQSKDNFSRFLIDLSVKPDVSTEDVGLIGDVLTIVRDDSTSLIHEFNMVVNQRTLSEKYLERFEEEFFNSIVLLDETFTDVYSNVPSYPEAYKYYYNAQHGLIAYIDNTGEIWRID